MKTSKNTVSELTKTWRTLYKDAKNKKKIKFEMFESAFNQTYKLLAEQAGADSLNKQHAQLVAEAYLFAQVNDNMLESVCLAASVLTERLLKNFVFGGATVANEKAEIFVLETHEEIQVNFKDVNESISKLAKAYDEAFDRRLCQ